jgi:hypothetical protein
MISRRTFVAALPVALNALMALLHGRAEESGEVATHAYARRIVRVGPGQEYRSLAAAIEAERDVPGAITFEVLAFEDPEPCVAWTTRTDGTIEVVHL